MRSMLLYLASLLLPAFLIPAFADTCPSAPANATTSVLDKDTAEIFSKVLIENPGCTQTVTTLCSVTKTDLSSLKRAAILAAAANENCASGSDGMKLSDTDKQWYEDRAVFWNALYTDMLQKNADLVAGTYVVSQAFHFRFLGLSAASSPTAHNQLSSAANSASQKKEADATPNKPATSKESPPKPVITSIQKAGPYTTVTGIARQDKEKAYAPKKILVCSLLQKPDNPDSLPACMPQSNVVVAKLQNSTEQNADEDYIVPDADGSFTAIVRSALPSESYLYVAEIAEPVSGGTALPQLLSTPVAITTFQRVAPLGAGAVGLDITGASSTDAQPVFLATGIMDLPLSNRADTGARGFWLNGQLRIAGMAQPDSLKGNIGSSAAFQSYLANALNANPDSIIQSVEASLGLAYQVKSWNSNSASLDVGDYRKYGLSKPETLLTLSLIGGFGAITPLSVKQFQPTIYNLTQQIYDKYQDKPSVDGMRNIDFGNSCQGINDTSNPSSEEMAVPCYAAFVPTDRTHFYRNYEAGLRLKIYAGDYPDDKYRFPGVADLTIGQNEYVTGGKFRKTVLHFGGVLPVPRTDALYVFGSMDVRMSSSAKDQEQLILTPATVSDDTPLTLTGPGVTVIPVAQPTRDRYRIGIGLDILHLLSTLSISKNIDATKNNPPASAQAQ